jgi:hypothetical protein
MSDLSQTTKRLSQFHSVNEIVGWAQSFGASHPRHELERYWNTYQSQGTDYLLSISSRSKDRTQRWIHIRKWLPDEEFRKGR